MGLGFWVVSGSPSKERGETGAWLSSCLVHSHLVIMCTLDASCCVVVLGQGIE